MLVKGANGVFVVFGIGHIAHIHFIGIADLFANALNGSHRIDWYFVYLSRHLTDGRGTAMLRVMKGDERSAEKPCNEQNSTSACH